MRHARFSPLLAGLALWAGCQKSDPEIPSAAAAPQASEKQTAAASPALSMEEEMPALPLIPTAEVISDLAPRTPLGELPLAIVPKQETVEIKPEIAAAFDKLFEPNLDPQKWEATHLSLVE